MRRVVVALLLVMAACSPRTSFEAEISVVSTDDGPGFAPAMRIVYGNTGTLTVTNTLDGDHGFSIDELGVSEVVGAGESVTVELGRPEAIDYQYYCQLHDIATGKGGHRRGVLRVGR